MSHYDLMDASQMSEEDAALMRARLHFYGGKRRLEEGLSAAGVVALYDALLFGMRYFIARPQPFLRLDITNNEDLWDHAALYHTLTKAGVFDDPYAFNHLSLIVEQALWDESFPFDANSILTDIEQMLLKLGVLPSNDASGDDGPSVVVDGKIEEVWIESDDLGELQQPGVDTLPR